MDEAKGMGHAGVLAAFGKQVGWCEELGAPFTARLLRMLADDLRRDGPTARLVGAWPGDPVADALPLRLAGALHALVLSDADPALAACYPPGDAGKLGATLLAALTRHEAFIRGFLLSPPQTNEVGRSAVLLGGFLQVAHDTGMPLRLLEIGASAGLNLLWDRYGYRIGDGIWGDPASSVQLMPRWSGPLPRLATPAVVAERAGCDLAPIELGQPEARLRLRGYVWADQPERLRRIDGAIALARAAEVVVERADAVSWVAKRLGAPAPGRATVLCHSIMWQYMPAASQAALRATIERAGAAATVEAPLAWLRFEPSGSVVGPELRLTSWPGARDRRLATAHPHGAAVSWEDAS